MKIGFTGPAAGDFLRVSGTKIPRSCGPPPLTKGAIGGFVFVAAEPLQLIFIHCDDLY